MKILGCITLCFLIVSSSFSQVLDVSNLIRQGDEFLAQKNYLRAKEAFSQAVKMGTNNSQAHRGMGDVYYSKANRSAFKMAREEYKQSVNLDSNNAKGHCGLARCHLMFREFDEAIKEAQKALEINPNYAEAQFVIAGVYNNIAADKFFNDESQVKKMIDAYLKVLEIDPDYESAINNVSIEYARKMQYDKALEILLKFVERHPKNVSVLLTVAKTYRLKQEFGETQKFCNRVLFLEPKNKNAKELIEIARKGEIKRGEILDLTNEILGELLKTGNNFERGAAQKLLAGKNSEVITELNKKNEQNISDGMTHFLLALAYSLNGNSGQASSQSAKAIGFHYQDKYLEKFHKLAFQYDLSLTPFIR